MKVIGFCGKALSQLFDLNKYELSNNFSPIY